MTAVHIRDLVALLVRAVDDGALRGAFNVTAPNPVTNKEFTRTLGRVLHRPTVLPLPPLALRLRFGEAASVLTASQRCLPEAALKTGFTFQFGTLEGALRDILD
jgi:NAD dependent epimerase/dehydratase family enzyme